MLSSTYAPGTSRLHRLGPGPKLAGLLVLTTLLVAVPTPAVLGAVALALVLVVALAGPGVGLLVDLARPLRWIVLVLTPFQVWSVGWERALVVVGGLVVAMVAAGVVTATTRVADMMDTVVTALRPLGRLGIDADRVGLLLALAIRSIPVVHRTVGECADARRARGLECSPRALLVPVVVRTVRHAERVGEALVARGLDDDAR